MQLIQECNETQRGGCDIFEIAQIYEFPCKLQIACAAADVNYAKRNLFVYRATPSETTTRDYMQM